MKNYFNTQLFIDSQADVIWSQQQVMVSMKCEYLHSFLPPCTRRQSYFLCCSAFFPLISDVSQLSTDKYIAMTVKKE